MNGITRLCLLLALMCFSLQSHALSCWGGGTIDFNGFVNNGSPQQTFYIDIDGVSLTNTTTDIVLTDMSAYAGCYGAPDATWQDAMRSSSLTLSSSELKNLGFQVYLDAGGTKSSSPPNVCIWPDNLCSVGLGGSASRPIIARIAIKRASGSGDWSMGTTIPAGTEIARMKAQVRAGYSGNGTNFFDAITWVFRLKTPIVIPAYTCSITSYDKNVALPDVSRSDFLRNGTGRYTKAKKEFTFNLACQTGTSVSVTFEGQTLSGTDNVLKNTLTGNDNVGIQLLFGDDKSLVLGSKYSVYSSAGASEILKLNAYYYYKGGTITAGQIKANTTFTFNYQ